MIHDAHPKCNAKDETIQVTPLDIFALGWTRIGKQNARTEATAPQHQHCYEKYTININSTY